MKTFRLIAKALVCAAAILGLNQKTNAQTQQGIDISGAAGLTAGRQETASSEGVCQRHGFATFGRFAPPLASLSRYASF